MQKPRAMILAAGLGTRLKPLTDTTPKALLEFEGKPMIDHVLDKLLECGFTEVVVNLHHHGTILRDYLESGIRKGPRILFSDETDQLLDTGGGIVRAKSLFDPENPVLVHNVDILSTIDLNKFYKEHAQGDAMATLAVSHRETSRNLLVDRAGLLKGWRDNRSGEQILVGGDDTLQPVAFSGIHLLDPRLFELLPKGTPFSITKAYLEIARSHPIQTFDHSADTWIDMAHPSNFTLGS